MNKFLQQKVRDSGKTLKSRNNKNISYKNTTNILGKFLFENVIHIVLNYFYAKCVLLQNSCFDIDYSFQ